MSYRHPRNLMAELRKGEAEARTELQTLCGDALAKCAENWRGSPSNQPSLDALLRWLGIFLSSRSESVFERLNAAPEKAWAEFRAYALVVVSKWLLWPEPIEAERGSVAGAEFRSRFYWSFDEKGLPALLGQPSYSGYETAIYQRPKFHLSGDVVQVAPRNGEIWILVADGAGKGVGVHLLMHGMALLWRQSAIENHKPEAVLRDLQEKLAPHTPFGFFVEAALARIEHSGRATLSAAGGVVSLHRASMSVAECRELSGCVLGGVDYDELEFETSQWVMAPGEEVLFSTDGYYDQSCGGGRLRDRLATDLATWAQAPTLFDAVVDNVCAALRDNAQDDDVSIAWLRAL